MDNIEYSFLLEVFISVGSDIIYLFIYVNIDYKLEQKCNFLVYALPFKKKKKKKSSWPLSLSCGPVE